jgi:hypothetical protein
VKYVKALAEFISQYPALSIGVVASALILLADYGVPVAGQHSLDIQGLVAAAIALAGAALTHTQVSPVAPVGPRPQPESPAAPPAA